MPSLSETAASPGMFSASPTSICRVPLEIWARAETISSAFSEAAIGLGPVSVLSPKLPKETSWPRLTNCEAPLRDWAIWASALLAALVLVGVVAGGIEHRRQHVAEPDIGLQHIVIGHGRQICPRRQVRLEKSNRSIRAFTNAS
jgi:hypothetical protein